MFSVSGKLTDVLASAVNVISCFSKKLRSEVGSSILDDDFVPFYVYLKNNTIISRASGVNICLYGRFFF